MKAYITKYALTKGILEVDDAEISKRYPRMITVKSLGDLSFPAYFNTEGRDWHRTLEAAIDRAHNMRRAKLLSLKKELERVKALDFHVIPTKTQQPT